MPYELPSAPTPATLCIRRGLLAASICVATLLCSCRVPTEVEPVALAEPRYAILFSESNLDFAQTAAWTKGPAGYSNLIFGLRDLLGRRGMLVDVLSENDLACDRLRDYRLLVVADTFSVSPDAEAAVRRFVELGGLLIGVNEVGRFQGSWTEAWHYADVFGVRPLSVDQFRTAVSMSPDLFRSAPITAAGLAHPLTAGLGDAVDFGEWAESAWVTTSETAVVLAEFPSYSRVNPGDLRTERVDEPTVAVALNAFGRGTAVWIAPNTHGRDPAHWESGDLAELLVRCTNLVDRRLSIPRRPPRTILGLSQIGYAPDERKVAIIRVPLETEPPFRGGAFRIIEEQSHATVCGGDLKREGPANPWRDFYYTADFSHLSVPGTYRFSARLDGAHSSASLTSGPFRIQAGLWSSTVVPTQYQFLRNYRCGAVCHTTDPIRGGYHDATGDYAVRMWSMPHVVYGLAEYLLSAAETNSLALAVAELSHALEWMLAMQDADGGVWSSVKPKDDASPIDKRPALDPTQRILETQKSLNYQTTYIAGMAHAARALESRDPVLADRAAAAARKCHTRIRQRNWTMESTGEVGNFLWASMELHKVTGEPAFLDQARTLAPVILDRQCRFTSYEEHGLRGDFFDGTSRRSFGDKQYKKFHAIGLYVGPVELAEALPADDPLRSRLVEALSMYFRDHFLKGSRLTPYGQMITALEPLPGGRFGLKFFTHPKSWVRLHGLNVDHFAMALAALRFARLTGIEQNDLRDAARAQAQWVVGVNPLGCCMIDYAGWTNPPAIADEIGTGRFPGGIPNGIVGDAHDRPAWGTTWDSREYWLPHNAYLLAVAPHLDRE